MSHKDGMRKRGSSVLNRSKFLFYVSGVESYFLHCVLNVNTKFGWCLFLVCKLRVSLQIFHIHKEEISTPFSSEVLRFVQLIIRARVSFLRFKQTKVVVVRKVRL